MLSKRHRVADWIKNDYLYVAYKIFTSELKTEKKEWKKIFYINGHKKASVAILITHSRI